MSLLILERSLIDRRRGFIGWAIGIASYVALQTSFYPSVQNSDLQRAIANYPKELKAFFGGAQAFDFCQPACDAEQHGLPFRELAGLAEDHAENH